MINECQKALVELGWQLKINETLRGLVKFSAQLRSANTYSSFKEANLDLIKAWKVVQSFENALYEERYVSRADNCNEGMEYLNGCVLFFGEWSKFFSEKMKIAGFDSYFLVIPEGGTKPQFCIERIDNDRKDLVSFKFVKDGAQLKEYTYKDNKLQTEKNYASYEDLVFSLFGH